MTKNILCFGDSNTWGLNPQTGKRFDSSERWPAQLATQLGTHFNIIAAGQPNRTLVNPPAFAGTLSGVSYLQPYLEKYELDMIMIALGSNDQKKRFNLTVADIANGLHCLINAIQYFYQQSSQYKRPKILIISPALTRECGHYANIYQGAEQKAQQLAAAYQQVASMTGCHFFDLATVAVVSQVDGVHLDKCQHQKVSAALTKIVKSLM